MAAAALAVALATTGATTGSAAQAQDSDGGNWQAKVFLSGVLPDGKVIAADGPAAGALAGGGTTASDNWVPTLAVEYFLAGSISLETICCATGHHISGTGALGGVVLADRVVVMPFTLTAKLHANLGPVRPYVGAGPALVVFPRSRTSAALQQMGLQDVSITPTPSLALQAGFDVPLNDGGLIFSADAKRYISHPDATFRNAAGVEQLHTRHRLDPWVVGAGLGLRF